MKRTEKHIKKVTLNRDVVVAMVMTTITDQVFNLGRIVKRITGLSELEVKNILREGLFNVVGRVRDGKL